MPEVDALYTNQTHSAFDRSLELVGRQLHVEPVSRLRGQVKFSGLEALSEQIGRDADAARSLLTTQSGVG